MTSLRNEIRLLGLSLEDGQTLRTICPNCNAAHEETFILTRDSDRLLYQCKRASCNTKGRIVSNSALKSGSHNQKKVFKPKYFEGEAWPLDEQTPIWSTLKSKYNFSDEDIEVFTQEGVTFELEDFSGLKFLHFPIYREGKLIGTCRKSINHKPKERRKSKLYPHIQGIPYYYFPNVGRSKELFIVEGCMDAIKLACMNKSAMALNGTSLNIGWFAEYLKEAEWIETVVLALDPDAQSIARRMEKDLSLFINSKVLALPKDPKDCTKEELNEYLGTLCS